MDLFCTGFFLFQFLQRTVVFFLALADIYVSLYLYLIKLNAKKPEAVKSMKDSFQICFKFRIFRFLMERLDKKGCYETTSDI